MGRNERNGRPLSSPLDVCNPLSFSRFFLGGGGGEEKVSLIVTASKALPPPKLDERQSSVQSPKEAFHVAKGVLGKRQSPRD